MPVTRTRSGRQIKKPELFTPTEEVVDDYGEDEHDSDFGSEIDTEDEYDSQDDSEFDDDDDEEADENGNLKDFVIDESDDDDEEI